MSAFVASGTSILRPYIQKSASHTSLTQRNRPFSCTSSRPRSTLQPHASADSDSTNGTVHDDVEVDEKGAVQGPQPVQGLIVDHLDELDASLLRSVYDGDVNAAESALGQGASASAVDRNRRSALHFAAANGLHMICSRLVEMGADVDLQDLMGLTALHMATGYKRLKTLEVLLEKGADPHIESLEGDVPFDLADKLLETTPKKRLFMDNPAWSTAKKIYDILDRVTEDEDEEEDEVVQDEFAGEAYSQFNSDEQAEDGVGTKFVIRRRGQGPTTPGVESESSDVKVTIRVKTKQKSSS